MAFPKKSFSLSEVVGQLRALGIQPGETLLVHTSFRAVRPVEDGPFGLIQALTEAVSDAGTLVMPSWAGDDDSPFDPEMTPANPDLGVVAEVFRQQDGVVRSTHPFAFAARGPKAAEIVRDPIALPPHQYASPVGRVLDNDGKILLIGVDHDSNTTIHLCELMANVPYRRTKHITIGTEDNPATIAYAENDHCCQRFKEANAWLDEAGLQASGPVANAPSKLIGSKDLVDVVTVRLKSDPFAFLHTRNDSCDECDDAWKSVSPNTL